ncbi:MAG TPA: N-acetylglucosamine-6-phosphate deacetylase, partial [Pyrinomonadaceae bacterium]|nr:N-acetylglucosamine-6-phosphate deacetylase [Pyrinomonadaceae bacterium]
MKAATETPERVSPANTVLLHNASIVLPERTAENASLLVHDDRITRVFEAAGDGLPSADSVVNLDGLTLVPGFIDVHIHGAVGVDTMVADTADLHRVSQFLATQGVTGWLATLVPAPNADYAQAIGAIAGAMKATDDARRGARILGVHYEGPFVNSSQCGALRKQFFRTFSGPGDIDSLPRIPGGDRQVVKHMTTLAPEIDGGIELVRELDRRGWIVSIGHSKAEFALLEKAFEAGARHMTHFMNAMSPLHHRSPGPIAWGLSRDDVTCDVIADGIHLDRHMLQVLFKLKGAAGLTLISDAVAAAGLGDGDYQIWGETINVEQGRTSNSAGSIAGSVISMLDAVRTMRSLGISEVELAQMASSNPA